MFANFKFRRDRSSKETVQLNNKMTASVTTVVEVNLDSAVSSPEASPTMEQPSHAGALNHKRSLSNAFSVFRRGSTAAEPISIAQDLNAMRNQSVSRSNFWDSRNPDVDAADVPRNRSVSSNKSQGPSPPVSRRPSYVPRNAVSSFRSTTTPREHINTEPTTGPTSTRRGSITVAGRTHSVSAASSSTRRPSLAGSSHSASDARRSTSVSSVRRSSSLAHIADRRPSLAATLSEQPAGMRRPSLAVSVSSSSDESEQRRSASFSRSNRPTSSVDTGRSGSFGATRMASLCEMAEMTTPTAERSLEALGFNGAVPVAA